jgi:hypothetical protein
VGRSLFPLTGQVSVLAVFLNHLALGFALSFGIFAVGLVLPILHLLGSAKLCFLAGNFVGVAGHRETASEDGQKNPRSNLACIHESGDGQILNLF